MASADVGCCCLCRVLYTYLVSFNGAVSSHKLNRPPFGLPGMLAGDLLWQTEIAGRHANGLCHCTLADDRNIKPNDLCIARQWLKQDHQASRQCGLSEVFSVQRVSKGRIPTAASQPGGGSSSPSPQWVIGA